MRRLLENAGWKLLSLAIAVVLWIAVVGEPRGILHAIPPQIRDLFVATSVPDSPAIPAGVR